MRFFRQDGGALAACDFVPQNAIEEISQEEYDSAIAALIAESQNPESDEATEADLMDALSELGVIS